MKINIVGLGSGSISSISYGAYKTIIDSKNIFFRTLKHPVIQELDLNEKYYKSFDFLYDTKDDFESVYYEIVNVLIDNVIELGEIVYAVPGNPKVAETSVEYLLKDKRIVEFDIKLNISASSSFLEEMFVFLDVDPIKNNLIILDALNFKDENLLSKTDILFTQVYSNHIASEVKLKLGDFLKDDSEVILFKGAGIKGLENKIKIQLSEIDKVGFEFDYLTSLFIPYNELNYKYKTIYDLVRLIAYLRENNDYPWEQIEKFSSLTDIMEKEFEQLLSALKNDDIENILEKNGRLLMFLIMQSRLAEEEYLFDFKDVIEDIYSRLFWLQQPNCSSLLNQIDKV